MKKAFTFALTCTALLVLALPAQAIYVSNCPQVCTPTCPCALQCQGPFGPTTCGAAGQACTPLTVTEDDTIFLSFEQRLAQLEAGEQSSEAPADEIETDKADTESQSDTSQEKETTEETQASSN